MKNNDEILEKFIGMIENSWTYAKLTKKERETFYEIFNCGNTKKLMKYDLKYKWDILNNLYHCFLLGLGYTPSNWRENEEAHFN